MKPCAWHSTKRFPSFSCLFQGVSLNWSKFIYKTRFKKKNWKEIKIKKSLPLRNTTLLYALRGCPPTKKVWRAIVVFHPEFDRAGKGKRKGKERKDNPFPKILLIKSYFNKDSKKPIIHLRLPILFASLPHTLYLMISYFMLLFKNYASLFRAIFFPSQ